MDFYGWCSGCERDTCICGTISGTVDRARAEDATSQSARGCSAVPNPSAISDEAREVTRPLGIGASSSLGAGADTVGKLL
eukprot:6186879-Pleurochrysis_carterae.AAC.1